MTTETTRRALFGGAGLVALAAAVPAIAGARHALPQDAQAAMPAVNPRLLRTIALRDRAEAECDRFDEEVEMPARRACAAEKAALPVEEAPPHREVATAYVNLFGETVRLSTARVGSVASARQMVRDPKPSDMEHPEWRQARLELVALADERDAIVAAQTARRSPRSRDCRASSGRSPCCSVVDACRSILCPAQRGHSDARHQHGRHPHEARICRSGRVRGRSGLSCWRPSRRMSAA